METNDWHLDKRISIGHILTTATVAVAVLAWLFTLQSQQVETEVRVTEIEKRIEQEILNIRSVQASDRLILTNRLDRIEKKLDRLIERQ